MKPRNREINIFNMSLLDILCGALGTFCFLMLVLFPFYKPGQAKEQPDVGKQIDPKNYQDALDRVHQLQDQLSKCRANNQNCQSKKDDADKQISRLQVRNPMVLLAQFDGPNHVDLFVEDDFHSTDGKSSPRVDARTQQNAFWTGDHYLTCEAGPCAPLWIIRDTPAGEFRVYLKMLKQSAEHRPSTVSYVTIVPPMDPEVHIPAITLTREGEVVKVATVTMGADGHAKVRIDVVQK